MEYSIKNLSGLSVNEIYQNVIFTPGVVYYIREIDELDAETPRFMATLKVVIEMIPEPINWNPGNVFRWLGFGYIDENTFICFYKSSEGPLKSAIIKNPKAVVFGINEITHKKKKKKK